MVTVTQEGKKVGIISSIGNYFKVSGTRSIPRIIGGLVTLYGAGVILKTAWDQTPVAVNALISNATIGGYNLESIIGDDPESTKAKIGGVIIAGTAGFLGYLGMKYAILPLWRGGKKVVGQSSELASDSYDRKAPYREIEEQVRIANAQGEAQVRIAGIQEGVEARVNRPKRTEAI